MLRKTFAFCSAAAILMSFAGCANHLEDITKEVPENSRTQLGERQYIVNMDKEFPDSASFPITVEETESVKVTIYQVRKISSLYTPYEGWRESYEVLTGICLFPFAIVSNVFSTFTFGMFPFSWSSEVTKYAFDGMNPCMNFESYSRAEEIPAKVERTLVDSYTESKKHPLANEWLVVKTDDNAAFRVRTNALGQAEITLLSMDLNSSAPIVSRHLDIYIEKNNAKCKTIPLSRRLLTRLASARKAMMKYSAAPSGAALAACVQDLEALSFEKLAFQLEENELKKHPEFKSALDQSVK